MWWLMTAALAMGPGPMADADGPAARRAQRPPEEEPLDLERLRETGDVPLLTDLPTRGRLGPLRVRLGRQKSPFLASYLEDVRSTPLSQRTLASAAVDADRMVGGGARWTHGPVAITAAAGHPDNLRGVAWDLLARGEVHAGALHVGAGGAQGQHDRFASRVVVADRFRWLELDPRRAFLSRTSADLHWNPAPIRLDAEAASLRAGKGKRPLRVRSASAGLAVMLTGEKRPVDARVQPRRPWDPESGHLGALELGTRFETVYATGEGRARIEQLSVGLTAHPLRTLRLPLVWTRAWMGQRSEDRLMLRITADR